MGHINHYLAQQQLCYRIYIMHAMILVWNILLAGLQCEIPFTGTELVLAAGLSFFYSIYKNTAKGEALAAVHGL